jgi:hypothetical protein
MNSNDIKLLRRFVLEGSEAAFAELVRQHIALVYSAALWQTSADAHLAGGRLREFRGRRASWRRRDARRSLGRLLRWRRTSLLTGWRSCRTPT